MFLQIADGSNAELVRAITPHYERVGVVETERLCHSNSCFAQLINNEVGVDRIASFQNFLRDSAGILWIGIDLSSEQRLPKNNCPAHALPMLGGNSPPSH